MGDSPKSNAPQAIDIKPELKPSVQQVDSPVQIEDLIVTGDLAALSVAGPNKVAKMPLGEFELAGANTKDQTTRLLTYIKDLSGVAATTHKNQNLDSSDNIKKGHENNIVRMITNEFSFFTATPLTADEFKALHAEIQKHAATLPENLQLTLSSFAVRTEDNKLLNIVVNVECGKTPKIHCFAKNQFSSIDPIYYDVAKDGTKTPLPYITKTEMVKKMGPDVTPKVSLKGLDIGFSNVFECTTAGKAKFIAAIDVCLDHKYGTAKAELNRQLQSALTQAKTTKTTDVLPIQISHVLTSNSIGLHPDYAVDRVTHADPYQTPWASADYAQTGKIGAPVFGTPTRVAITRERPCSLLPEMQMDLVQQHTNESALHLSTSRAIDYIQTTLTSTAQNASLDVSQKQEKAQNCVHETLSSIHSLDELQKLFEYIETQSKSVDSKPGALSYLRQEKDATPGFPPRFENIVHLIQTRATEMATKSNKLDHPLLNTLKEYGKNFEIPKNDKSYLGASLLNSSVRNSDLKGVSKYLETKSPNLRDPNGDFAIHIAAEKGNVKILEVLLQKGANPNVTNRTQQTPLELAIDKNQADVVEMLLKNGADPNWSCSDGKSPLIACIIKNQNHAIIDSLLKHGADLDKRDNNKLLPIEAVYLHVNNDKYKLLNKLFTAGAKPGLASIEGKTLVQYGLEKNDLNLLTVISNRIMFSNDEIRKHELLKNPPAPVVASAPAKPGVAPSAPLPAPMKAPLAPPKPDTVIAIKPVSPAPKDDIEPIVGHPPASPGFLSSIGSAFSNLFGSSKPEPKASEKAKTLPEAPKADHIVVDIAPKEPPKTLNPVPDKPKEKGPILTQMNLNKDKPPTVPPPPPDKPKDDRPRMH